MLKKLFSKLYFKVDEHTREEVICRIFNFARKRGLRVLYFSFYYNLLFSIANEIKVFDNLGQ